MVDDEVRYVTALGTSDEAGGWRENKARGGVLIDVALRRDRRRRACRCPTRPRWYRGRLWVLESGEGNIGYVDLDTGKVETVAQLPGFTRGLAFAGPLAFVGLSQVRESATFGGIPLTGRLEERQCGVWVVNIETGQTIAFLRFEDLVQEIFAVKVLPGIALPGDRRARLRCGQPDLRRPGRGPARDGLRGPSLALQPHADPLLGLVAEVVGERRSAASPSPSCAGRAAS